MPSSPTAWLWARLKRELPADQYDRLRADYLAEMRAYCRMKNHSPLAPAAPRAAQGRKGSA